MKSFVILFYHGIRVLIVSQKRSEKCHSHDSAVLSNRIVPFVLQHARESLVLVAP